MTELLKYAFDVASALPQEKQDEIARILLDLAAGDGAVIALTPEEIADLDEADKEVARGETVSLDEAEAFWARHKF